ncbi:MAG: patatin-like phospholipase family protein [Pseudomonadota bacterium]
MLHTTNNTRNKHAHSGLVLALGGGGAPGLAHIGVLQVLQENDVAIRAIAGTSIGAEIGAFVASGMPINQLAEIACAFDWKQTLQLFMPDLPTGGLVSGENIVVFLDRWLGARFIQDLDIGYVAIATDISNGEQVIIDRDSLVDAVRASLSVPGLIAPHPYGKRLLTDGGVVNPVPFDVARDRFGGPVIAVAVHGGARALTTPTNPESQWPARVRQLLDQPWMTRVPGMRTWLEIQLNNHVQNSKDKSYWYTRRVLDRVVNITEAQIVKLRAALKPPDLMLTPDVSDIGPLEFYRANDAIAVGRRAAEENLPEILKLIRDAEKDLTQPAE